MELEILTIPEYIEAMKSYYANTENVDEVIHCISPQGYEFWTKCKDLDEIGEIYWKHEPLMKMEFNNKEEVIKALRITSSGIIGCNFRWLPGNKAAKNTVIFQPIMIRGVDDVMKLCDNKLKDDKLCGILMDPFVYIGPDNIKEYTKESNYRLFIKRITAAEFNDMKARYSDSFDGVYEDDYMRVEYCRFSGFKDEFSEFLKKNCPTFK